jgi:hypothetical protein
VRVALALLIVCCTAGPLAAQSAAQAEALFRQGKDLMSAGKYAEACAAFEASQKAEAATSTLLNLANCREKNGELATAWGLFVDVERETRTAGDAAGKQFHTTASDRASKLEHRISHLTIGVSDKSRSSNLQVTRDGVTVDAASWNHRLPIDGGKHVIEAKAPGHKPWKLTIDIAEHDDDRQVEIPTLAEDGEGEGTATPEHEDHTDAPVQRGGSSHVGAWVLTATTVILAGSAVGFEFWARDTYDKSLIAQDPDSQQALYKSANRKRYVADGAAIGAIGCAIGAVFLFVRSGHDSSGGSTAQLQPIASPDSAGFAVVGRW